MKVARAEFVGVINPGTQQEISYHLLARASYTP